MGFGSGTTWKGNKLGRPKRENTLADYIRRRTRNGVQLVEFYMRVLEDEKEPTHLRLHACGKLEERAFGRAPQVIEQTKHVEHSFIMILDRPKSGEDKQSTRMIEIFRTPGAERIVESDAETSENNDYVNVEVEPKPAK